MTNRVDCPRCGGYWYQDLEAYSNLPYTCFCCGNGTRKFTQADLDAANAEHDAWMARYESEHGSELSAGQRAAMAELADY